MAGRTDLPCDPGPLTSGVKPSDPVIQCALPFIRELKPKHTYIVALQTIVLAEMGDPKDLKKIEENVKWLLSARIHNIFDQRKLEGWSYGKKHGSRGDNSNTQYALLGLYYALGAGVKIEQNDWQEIREFYRHSQDPSGGWLYGPIQDNPRHTMTIAGICGWLIASLEAYPEQQNLYEKTGDAANCGKYGDNEVFTRGMNWLSKKFHFEERGLTFCNFYDIERVGRLSGQRFVGGHDWYREGCELLTVRRTRPSIRKRMDPGKRRVA